MKIFPELLEDNLDFRKVKFFDNSQYLIELEASKSQSLDAGPHDPAVPVQPILPVPKGTKKTKKGIAKKPKKQAPSAAKPESTPATNALVSQDLENPTDKPLAAALSPPPSRGLVIEAELLKEETFSIEVMKTHKAFQTIYIVCCFLSGGLLIVLNHWLKNYLFIFATHVEVTRFEDGNSVVVRSKDNKIEIAKLKKRRVYLSALVDFETYVFEFRGCTYFWSDTNGTFQELQVFARSTIVKDFLESGRKGRHPDEIDLIKRSFRHNLLGFKRSLILRKIKNMLLSPLSVMEVVFILLLIYIEFIFYAVVLAAFLATNVWILVKTELEFERHVQHSFKQTESLTLWRKNAAGELRKMIIDQRDVVLGDLVELTNGTHTTFDLLLIQGECFAKDSNVGRESREFKLSRKRAATGDSIHRKNIIEAGSQVLTNLNDVNSQCLAIVLGIGLNTKKGIEIQRILNNTHFKVPYKSELYRLCRYFLVLCFILCFTFVALDHILAHPIMAFRYNFSKAVRIILVCFKPTLPLAIFAAILFSERRLQELNIQTRNREKIGKSNQISQFWVEQNLLVARDFLTKGFIVAKAGSQGKVGFEKTLTRTEQLLKSPSNQAYNRLFMEAFSLSNDFFRIGNENIGQLWRAEIADNSLYDFIKTPAGQHSRFVLKQAAEEAFEGEYEVLQTSSLKTSNTFLVRSKSGRLRVFSQMSPEFVSERCTAATIPSNYEKTILKMSVNGLKCVCFGYKDLETPAGSETPSIPEDWDSQLTFLGIYLLQPDYFENFVALSRQLEEAKVRTTLLCKSSIAEALYHLKSTHTISNRRPVVFVPRQAGHAVRRWLKIEFNNIQNKISLENVTGTDGDGPVVFDESFWSKNNFVFEGAAACRYLSNETDENCRLLFENTVAFVSLSESQRVRLLRKYSELFPANNLGYLFRKLDSASVLRLPMVSFALGNHSLHTQASFLIPKIEIAKAYTVLKEGRSAHFLTSAIFQFLIFFIALQYAGLLIMTIKQTTFTLNQLLFLDFFVLFGVSVTLSLIRKSDSARKRVGNSALSLRQFVKTGVVFFLAAFLMLATMLLLWKVPYYDSPIDLVDLNDAHPYPDKYFFYEPFLIFWSVGVYSLLFVFIANRKIIFNNTYKQKLTFLGYVGVMMAVCLLLLFLHRFKLKRYFVHRLTIALRVPYLFGGFDSILFLKLIFDAIFIYAAFVVGKRLARKVKVAPKKSGQSKEAADDAKLEQECAVSLDSGSFGSSCFTEA